MPPLFILDVATDPAARRATLRLADDAGRHLAHHEVDLDAHPPARWSAAFDTRAHVRRMARRGEKAEQQLDDLGAFLGAHVLGDDIARRLAAGIEARTLLVRVHDDPGDRLAVAFAGLPWDIARAKDDDLTLLQRAVSVRVALDSGRSCTRSIEPVEALPSGRWYPVASMIARDLERVQSSP